MAALKAFSSNGTSRSCASASRRPRLISSSACVVREGVAGSVRDQCELSARSHRCACGRSGLWPRAHAVRFHLGVVKERVATRRCCLAPSRPGAPLRRVRPLGQPVLLAEPLRRRNLAVDVTDSDREPTHGGGEAHGVGEGGSTWRACDAICEEHHPRTPLVLHDLGLHVPRQRRPPQQRAYSWVGRHAARPSSRPRLPSAMDRWFILWWGG